MHRLLPHLHRSRLGCCCSCDIVSANCCSGVAMFAHPPKAIVQLVQAALDFHQIVVDAINTHQYHQHRGQEYKRQCCADAWRHCKRHVALPQN